MSSTGPALAQGKVWLITSATSPLGFSTARLALRNGDSVIAGCSSLEFAAWKLNASAPPENATPDNTDPNAHARPRKRKLAAEEVEALDVGVLSRLGGSACLVVPLSTKSLTSCQASLAHAVSTFGRVDILLSCTSHTYYGSLEEYSEWHAREQFEVSYFGTINIVKTVVRDMRERGIGGHIICVTSLAAQTGTPGLSLLTAAHHAVEGFTEALAFEIAPFNIKLTNVEPSLMTYLLTNPVHLPPRVPEADNEESVEEEPVDVEDGDLDDDDDEGNMTLTMNAQSVRRMLESVAGQPTVGDGKSPMMTESGERTPETGGSGTAFPPVLRYPGISAAMQLELVAETTKVIVAVAGKDNPPARIIVGGEDGGEDGEGGVQSIKERMKAVSEELEEFLECAMSVDVPNAVVDEQADDAGNPLLI
ncbi:hypothetical protein DRE_02359 [Drechslerella stenobrocha 248]|uniref:Uncharacterized protein n=1 Tax=Drechslerella stenobrocha 248 TaxID=1043628 RepID=W7IGE3_9PEZI|nr:hypothetical protein DRE_02359 [Drechslerella stenobrocha 248]